MTKVLIVETNTQRYKSTNDPTGLWLGESAEFVDEVQKAGFEIDYVSPMGGFVPLDPRSMKYTSHDTMRIYEDPDFINHALSNTLTPTEINPNNYQAIYYTGGHGVMWDFPDNAPLQKIAITIYKNNGYLLSVCHGIAGLFNLKDDQGKYVISGKNITGFTSTEEILAGKKSLVPFLNQQMAEQRGAKFRQKRFYSNYAIKDDHIITGQNPFSVRSVAKLFIQEVR